MRQEQKPTNKQTKNKTGWGGERGGGEGGEKKQILALQPLCINFASLIWPLPNNGQCCSFTHTLWFFYLLVAMDL